MSNSLSDEDLMSQVRSGVGEMLGVLFERYHVPLFNFYLKLTGDRPVSEDLVQEVFFRILKYRHSYRADTAFRAWMYQIAATPGWTGCANAGPKQAGNQRCRPPWRRWIQRNRA